MMRLGKYGLCLFGLLTMLEAALAQNSNPDLKALNGHIIALYQAGKYSEAIPLSQQLAADAKVRFGESSTEYATALNNLAQLLEATNRPAEAEPLMRRALAIHEKNFGTGHPNVAIALNNLAQLLEATNRPAEAEVLMRRALAIYERSYGAGHPSVAIALSNLALLLQDTDRLTEAEPLIRRALAIDEKSLGPEHPDVARDLNNLAQLLQAKNHLAEAEPLMRRVLAIDEKSLGPAHPNVAIALNNLAHILEATNRVVEAESLMRRALAINEESFGSEHPNVAISLNNLAALLEAANRPAEAEPMMRRALAINEKSFGSVHPNVAVTLNNLAQLLKSAGRLAEAEPMMRRALAIDEKSLGPQHQIVALRLNNLAGLLEEQGDWSEAIALHSRAKPIMTSFYDTAGVEPGAPGWAFTAQNTRAFRAHVRALFRAGAGDSASLTEGFELAQWALQNEAAQALSAMAARFAKSGAGLGKLLRDEQDLIKARERAYRALDAAAGAADPNAAQAAREAIAAIEAELSYKQAQLRREFPGYAEFTHPKPLSLSDTQALISDNQALVLFLDLPRYGNVPEETIVFALTKNGARWTSISLGTSALQTRVTTLRCGLDNSAWSLEGKGRERCKMLLNAEAAEDELPPFDASVAYALYRDLFGGSEDLIRDKALLIVPSGALTALPFGVLVTKQPDQHVPRFAAYETASWLGAKQAITVLPSVASLKALRIARQSSAPEPFIGFGNPLLAGQDGRDMRAWGKQSCAKIPAPRPMLIANRTADFASAVKEGQVNVESLRHQPPLPETADELCEAARTLGVPEARIGSSVFLGGRATVSQVKALSKSGDLARRRVIHFATHGLVAGQTLFFARNKAEPALLLTPPNQGKSSEEDNGLLTASEVAQLNLNADWVVLSACNTAAGSSEGAEALSGLAKAFFYAGARALLVSHWEVNSDAAVAITTGAISAIKAEFGIGRAEALRRSVASLIGKGGPNAHPSIWAPFVLVGNGEP